MQFAVNYSVPMENLLREGAADCDLLKCPEWEGVVNAARPLRRCISILKLLLGTEALSIWISTSSVRCLPTLKLRT